MYDRLIGGKARLLFNSPQGQDGDQGIRGFGQREGTEIEKKCGSGAKQSGNQGDPSGSVAEAHQEKVGEGDRARPGKK